MKDENQDLRKRTKDVSCGRANIWTSTPAFGDPWGALYREACRARSNAEFVSKIGDCLTELEETSYWLDLLADSGTVRPGRLALLIDETSQLTAIFTSISKKMRSRS